MEVKEIVKHAMLWAADLYGSQFLNPLLEEVVRDGNWQVTVSFEPPHSGTFASVLGGMPAHRLYKVIEVDDVGHIVGMKIRAT